MNKHKFRIDPITASVILGALNSIANEMGFKLMRMSHSGIIRESEDFGAAICDSLGRQLCECSQSTPLQSGPIPGYIKGICNQLEQRGVRLNNGDIIIHNNPYEGASHSPDIGICAPIFHDKKLVAFSMTTAHHLDIGSSQPGSIGLTRCFDRYSEGLYFNAIKIEEKGKSNSAVWQIIRDNFRVSEVVIGDIQAQIAACKIGVERFQKLIERFGMETISLASEDLFDYSDRLMRQQIVKIPDGIYEAIGYIDGFIDSKVSSEKMIPIKIAIKVSNSDMEVDFSGSGKQLKHAALNMPFNGTVDVAVHLALRTILLDSNVHGPIPQNEGLFRAVKIKAPEGTIVNPTSPVATVARATGGNRVADTVIKALSQIIPFQSCAGCGNLKGLAFSGLKDDDYWVQLEIFEGSYGGRNNKDGMDCVDTLYANTRNNPIEDVESHAPLLIRRYEMRNNSCAAGKYRGGLNSVKEYEFLSEGILATEGDNHLVKAWGLNGGHEGANAKTIVTKVNGDEMQMPSMCPPVLLKSGDRVTIYGATGGGFGDPYERLPKQVYSDFMDEIIDATTARNDYGVIINDGIIDLHKTKIYRSNKRKDR